MELTLDCRYEADMFFTKLGCAWHGHKKDTSAGDAIRIKYGDDTLIAVTKPMCFLQGFATHDMGKKGSAAKEDYLKGVTPGPRK